ncbi:MAG TPA: hypothetical protein DCE33_14165 [Rhodospirillaceae bacterium]|nr:hypothetical protein [Rhodospirillaceae bacterium]
MTELEVFDPTGAIEITQLHAARLDGLDGKKVGIVSNDEWQAHRTLPLVEELLRANFPGIDIVPAEKFPLRNEVIDSDELVEAVRAQKVDAVIMGNAA